MAEHAGVRVWRSRSVWLSAVAVLIVPVGLGMAVWSAAAGDGPFGVLIWAYLALTMPMTFWPSGRREARVGPSGISVRRGNWRQHIPWAQVAGVRTVTVANGVQRRVLVTTHGRQFDVPAVPRDELDQLVPEVWRRPVRPGPGAADVSPRSWSGIPRSQWLTAAATAVGLGVAGAILVMVEPGPTWLGVVLLVLALLAITVGPFFSRERVEVDLDGIRIRSQNPNALEWVPWSRIDRIETATSPYRGEHVVLHLDDGLTEPVESVPVAEAASLDPRRWRAPDPIG